MKITPGEEWLLEDRRRRLSVFWDLVDDTLAPLSSSGELVARILLTFYIFLLEEGLEEAACDYAHAAIDGGLLPVSLIVGATANYPKVGG